MIRKGIYITENQQEEIKKLVLANQRVEAEIIRTIIDKGIEILKNGK